MVTAHRWLVLVTRYGAAIPDPSPARLSDALAELLDPAADDDEHGDAWLRYALENGQEVVVTNHQPPHRAPRAVGRSGGGPRAGAAAHRDRAGCEGGARAVVAARGGRPGRGPGVAVEPIRECVRAVWMQAAVPNARPGPS